MRNEIVENCLYMIGEARDFLDREERDLLALVDKLDEGKITPIAARLKIALDFAAAHKTTPLLQFRIIKDIPEGIA